MRVIKPPKGRHVIVNPASRWDPKVMRAIQKLDIWPVMESEFMPVDRLYVVNPEEIEPLGEINVLTDRLIDVRRDDP